MKEQSDIPPAPFSNARSLLNKILIWVFIYSFAGAFWMWVFAREERRLLQARTQAVKAGIIEVKDRVWKF